MYGYNIGVGSRNALINFGKTTDRWLGGAGEELSSFQQAMEFIRYDVHTFAVSFPFQGYYEGNNANRLGDRPRSTPLSVTIFIYAMYWEKVAF